MTRLLKGAALFGGVVAIVWIAVLWRWNSTGRTIGMTDVLVYLVALPVVVCAVFVGMGWAWRTAQPQQATAAAPAGGGGGGEASDRLHASAMAREEEQRYGVLQLLAAHAVSSAGDSLEQLIAAAAAGQPRPELAPDLRDTDGMAVLCARIVDLSESDLAESLASDTEGLRKQRPEWADADVGGHVYRALAALADPLRHALQDLQPWAEQIGEAVGGKSHGSAVTQERIPASPALLRVIIGWPQVWSDFERELATNWARATCAEHSPLAAARLALTAQATSGPELWLHAEQLLQTIEREGRDDLVLVAACHSDISESAVQGLEDAVRLYAPSRQPKGVIPGEAAAALLLARAGWPADPDRAAAPVRLHRAALLRRDKSIETAGRVNSHTVQDAIAHALAAGRLPAEGVGALVCDADQHTGRGTELFGATASALPLLETEEDMVLMGTVTGHVGAVDALLVVAAAAHRAREDDKPCLALALGNPIMRLAMVVRPELPADLAPPPSA